MNLKNKIENSRIFLYNYLKENIEKFEFVKKYKKLNFKVINNYNYGITLLIICGSDNVIEDSYIISITPVSMLEIWDVFHHSMLSMKLFTLDFLNLGIEEEFQILTKVFKEEFKNCEEL